MWRSTGRDAARPGPVCALGPRTSALPPSANPIRTSVASAAVAADDPLRNHRNAVLQRNHRYRANLSSSNRYVSDGEVHGSRSWHDWSQQWYRSNEALVRRVWEKRSSRIEPLIQIFNLKKHLEKICFPPISFPRHACCSRHTCMSAQSRKQIKVQHVQKSNGSSIKKRCFPKALRDIWVLSDSAKRNLHSPEAMNHFRSFFGR